MPDSPVWHILAFHGYGPAGTIAVNVTWMKRGFNVATLVKRIAACTRNLSYRFPVIQPVSSKVRHFSTFFLHILASLGTPLGQSR